MLKKSLDPGVAVFCNEGDVVTLESILWEMESRVSGKGYRMVCPLMELVGTPVREHDI